ncbi:MAG: SEC-C domain-containing protein [Acidobacteria bacterium]|nr:SEC-C domain-containing protein [Acidobacteriota bacterium]
MGPGREGKEVCDLLVVCGQHVIIFSDKHCRFEEGNDINLAWSRWFRKAVLKSADQVRGAERWIRSFPARLFLDRACRNRFPIALPTPGDAIFHRIVVAHGVSKPFKRLGGGSGSLMLMSDVAGNRHYDIPFTIGWVGDTSEGYVHVFDDTTLDIVVKTLDTITDFVWYLQSKERLFAGNTKISATGEEELLAYYLGHLNSEERHDFVFPGGYDAVALTEGHWERFLVSPERAAQLEADKVSYFWDGLIEKFSHHVMQGTQYEASPAGVSEQERIFRFMAKEPRTRRRMLSNALLEKVAITPRDHWGVRLILPSNPGDPHYVFLAFPHYSSVPEHENRTARRQLLSDYCMVTKLEHRGAEHIVGIATEVGLDGSPHTEDALYYDATDWTDAEEREARAIQNELGLLKNVKISRGTEHDYPTKVTPSSVGISRNSRCTCGSGKRYKRCCGRDAQKTRAVS